MTQLTIRGFDAELERAIRSLAKAEGLSLNQAALRLLRRGAGLASGADRNAVGDALDRFIGDWSDADRAAVDEAVRDFSVIDEDLWR